MSARPWYIRWGTIAVLLSLTACHAVTTPPQTPTKKTKKTTSSVAAKATTSPGVTPSPSTQPSTSVSASPSASPSATPTPLPSPELILSGTVTLDPRGLLAAGMAERTTSGVKLIGNHGAGLISDKGLGLISDKGLGLISNNSGSLIGKTKYTVAQVGGTSALAPAEGMVVEAFDLLTGELVAGPVATTATGSYQLGFLKTPSVNLQVVARVNNTTDAKFAYASLSKPDPAPITTGDTSRAVTSYILAVVPSRLGPIIDAHKAGDPAAAQAIVDVYNSEKQSSLMMKAFNTKLAAIPTAKLNELDADGRLAIGISERMVAFADLSKIHYKLIEKYMDEINTFDLSRATPANPPLVDQVLAYTRIKSKVPEIPGLLEANGMAPADASRLGDGIYVSGNGVSEDLGAVTLSHQNEVLGPLAPYFPGGFF